ncbi:MAG TPA: hypothetical protein VFE98_05470 [Candidatus Bathyarchaeia archaeon]|nr:hypothetical protein [Candidatus Bathyarchaeia archaeon]
MQAKPTRPTGVTVLGVLAILIGLGGIVFGGLLVLAAAVISTINIGSTYPQLAGYSAGTIAILLGALGGVLLIIGILYLVTGIGFFGGKGWAWTIGMIVSVLSIIANIVQAIIIFTGTIIGGTVVFTTIPLIIIYYLTRPHVKAFFGKGPSTDAPGTTPSA